MLPFCSFNRSLTALAGLVLMLVACSAQAQTSGPGTGGPNSGGQEFGGGAAVASGGTGFGALGLATSAGTAPAAVVSILNNSRQYCAAAPAAYRVDCLAAYFDAAAAVLPQSGKYGEMRKVLKDAARQLDALVDANLDTSKPQVRLQAGANGASTPRLRPVKPASVAAVNARAAKIVAEAETKLLRSADASSDVRLQYVRVAEAVGSNKVLLRS